MCNGRCSVPGNTQGTQLTQTMQRRRLLKVAGSIGAVSTAAGAGVFATSQGAQATAGTSISNPSSVTSDDGEISSVEVQTTGRLTWDGFDTPAKEARIISDVSLQRDGSELNEFRIHDTGRFDLTTDSWGGSGEETSLSGDHEDGQSGYVASDVDWGILQENRENNYNDGYGLPNNPAPTAPLYAGTDGGQQKTKVVLKATYLLFGPNGSELTGQEGYPDRKQTSTSFVVTVNNEEATFGTGDSDAEGDSGDSAEVNV